MPRKTKELETETVKKSKKIIDSEVKLDSNEVKKNTKKTSTAKKKTTETSKKTPSKAKEQVEKKSKASTTSSKKTSSAKSSTKKTASKTTTAKKQTTKASATKTKSKVATKKVSSKKTTNKEPVSIIEYYDLPYRYNQTIVKILAQTPQMLFVYWDISDGDRAIFEEKYGKDFFSTTKPVLIVHNQTMNYSFEIEINDFANSWYLHINDANCKYDIELGRRPYAHTSHINEQYIYVSSSNHIDAPNDHILFEQFKPEVTYKNTKTGTTSTKDFSSLANYKNMQKIYNIYDLYKQIYKDEIFNEILIDQSNPSSIFK